MPRRTLWLAGGLALVGILPGCAVMPQLAPVTIQPGCYVVNVDNWPDPVAASTGLAGLPAFIGLDTAVAGPRGRTVVVPVSWTAPSPHTRHAYWTEEIHGNRPASLVVTFVGPSGDFVANMEASRDGYAGEGIALARGSADRAPQVQVSLGAISCAGLRFGPRPVARPTP